jgi:YbbR domain-containing protein
VRNLLLHNWGLKAISLAGAVALWALIGSDPELETSISVPLEFHNMPRDLELVTEQSPNVHVVVRGPSGSVRQINRSEVAVVLDLIRVRLPGAQTFTLDAGQVVLPRGVRLVRAIPSQVRLVFEKRLTREVRVLPRFIGTYPAGYEIASYTVDPPMLKVVGPESRVELLDYITTDPIELSRLIGSASFPRNAYLEDPHLRFENLQSVRVHVEMKKK